MEVSRNSVIWLCLVTLCGLFPATFGSNVQPCPVGWVSYQKEVPNMCLYISDSTTSTLNSAHRKCVEKNASLIVIQSEEKMKFFRDIIQKSLGSSSRIWIGLQKSGSQVTWLTKDGNIPAEPLPSGMRFSNWNYRYPSYNTQGLKFTNNNLYLYDSVSGDARFICQKHSNCSEGWYGLGCDKQCHCHNQDCNANSMETTCHYGCQLGWMGKGCAERKEDAKVTFFCVNSQDLGKYTQMMIDTKGVHYEIIHAINEDDLLMPWCNNTFVHTDTRLSTVTIKIFPDNSTDDAMKEGSCAGKIDKSGKYEWKIKIQEKDGIVSRHDQEVLVECNFSDGDTFRTSGNTEIKHERWFRRSNVKRPARYLKERKEEVELLVVDPSTGAEVSQTNIGSAVALRINYGFGEDNLATGFLPYNCYAASKDGKQKKMFLDDKSCPIEGFLISQFSVNETSKALMTRPFPLFGFDGSDEVYFHCSYILCFGDDPCLANCDDGMGNQQNTTVVPVRRRRSARVFKPQEIQGSVGVILE